MSSSQNINNCVNHALIFLDKNPDLLTYIKEFNNKHNQNHNGFLYTNSNELKTIRTELINKGYNDYTIPATLQECENLLNKKN